MIDLSLGHTRLIVQLCGRLGLLRNQAAYILATAYWETARTMEPVREAFYLRDGEAYRKNLRYYPWYGRGFVQLTWRENYERAGRIMGLDLLSDPDAVMQPEIAAEILVVGCRDGWFTGKRLDDYLTDAQSNYRGARRVVNGTDKAAAIAELAREYEAALMAAGYGIEKPAPVINDRRDGSAPRRSMAQSKTIWAQVMQWVATVGAGVAVWWGGQSEAVKIAIVAGVTVVIICGAIILRERLRHWIDGVR